MEFQSLGMTWTIWPQPGDLSVQYSLLVQAYEMIIMLSWKVCVWHAMLYAFTEMSAIASGVKSSQPSWSSPTGLSQPGHVHMKSSRLALSNLGWQPHEAAAAFTQGIHVNLMRKKKLHIYRGFRHPNYQVFKIFTCRLLRCVTHISLPSFLNICVWTAANKFSVTMEGAPMCLTLYTFCLRDVSAPQDYSPEPWIKSSMICELRSFSRQCQLWALILCWLSEKLQTIQRTGSIVSTHCLGHSILALLSGVHHFQC